MVKIIDANILTMVELDTILRLQKLQLLGWPIVVIILFLTTSPKRSLLVSFIFFLIIWWWLSVVISAVRLKFYQSKNIKKASFNRSYYRFSSQLISLCLVMLIGLNTLHQLGFMDVVWTTLFGGICLFYIRRRMTE